MDVNFGRDRCDRIEGLYGMETGTITAGLYLLELQTPRFDTPAAIDPAINGVIVLPLMFLMMHLMNTYILLDWNLIITTISFILIFSVILVIFILISIKNKRGG